MDWTLWAAIFGWASAIIALLIAVGERGEKRELVKSRDAMREERDDVRDLYTREFFARVKAERLLTRELLRSDNIQTVDDAESVPVSFEERAG